ncbi:MAG: hypothetical protein CVU51_03745 [Deltaproteobacteria bacterium HGW-Deltaproteobacteria-1]|nr:MAG: hypothetical protein CVU51_03745 [Deltaproteobacteria bacterium HGW-Deltaproteobacteria-1]
MGGNPGAAGAQGAGGVGDWSFMIMMVVIFGIFYFLMIRLTDAVVTLEIADKVRIKVARSAIAAVLQKSGSPAPTTKS